MKIITSIYLNCRPELRNDWLVGVEADLEGEDALVGKPQEVALRTLIAVYNKRHYAAHMAPATEDSPHRRTDSSSAVFFDDPAVSGNRRRSRMDSLSSPLDDVNRPDLPYNPDGMIEFWLHEYEDVLREVFGDGTREDWDDGDDDDDELVRAPGAPGPAERDDAAWIRLGELMRARGAPDDDAISESESVVSVGELGDEARLDAQAEGREMFSAMEQRRRRRSQGENTWEVSLSGGPLTRSTCHRRSSCCLGGLVTGGVAAREGHRCVLLWGLERRIWSWAMCLMTWRRSCQVRCLSHRTRGTSGRGTTVRWMRWSICLMFSMHVEGVHGIVEQMYEITGGEPYLRGLE